MHFCGLGMPHHVTATISLALPTFLQMPSNSAQTLPPCAGDAIHPVLRMGGSGSRDYIALKFVAL